MKKFITLCLLMILFSRSFATVIPVTVTNFMFSPNTINAVVGDVIKFNWSAGNHTTTCDPAVLAGTSAPAGAATWSNPMNVGSTTFSYTLTVAGNYTFGCIPHFGLGMLGTITVSNVAPVTFGNFEVASGDKNAYLTWNTLTEQNTDHFSVKKSMDGVHFNNVGGTVPAAGNSSGLRTYTYTDDISADRFKFLYYEIVTTDLDGKESYSPIRILRSAKAADDMIVQLGPNPVVRPETMRILFNADGYGILDVKIYSPAGKLVLKNQLTAFYGLNNEHMHLCELAAGEYVAVFTLNGKKETRKIVVK